MGNENKQGRVTKAHCNKCAGERNQEVLHSHESRWSDPDCPISGSDQYEMIRCCGCEHVSLMHISYFSEDVEFDGTPIPTIRFYPPATFRTKPRWFGELVFSGLPVNENFVEKLLEEIYVALQNDCGRLAVMGIRALLEQIMIHKVGDHGTFKTNLDNFQTQGFISASQRTVIEPVLDAGHATIHRGFDPKVEDVGILVDVTESLVETIYINQGRAKRIAKNIPPRIKAKKVAKAVP